MSNLFVLKEQLQAFYAKYSKEVDKIVQFLLAFILALICAFLPGTLTVLVTAVLILIHVYALSMGVMIVTAALFAVMFIFYFRFTPEKSMIVLLVMVAYFFKIPFAVPMAFALMGTPICIILFHDQLSGNVGNSCNGGKRNGRRDDLVCHTDPAE